MSLQKYVQQLKPIQENYIKPDSRVQNLVESNTEYATLMEKAIVMAYNMKKKGRSEDEAANLGQIKMEDWQKEKKTLDSLRSDWEEESKNIVKKLKVGDHMIQLGRNVMQIIIIKNLIIQLVIQHLKQILWVLMGTLFQ